MQLGKREREDEHGVRLVIRVMDGGGRAKISTDRGIGESDR